MHNFGEVNKAAFVRLLEKVVRVRPALEERSLFQRTVVLDSGLGRPTILGVFHRLQRYFISDLYPFPTTDRRDFEKTRAVFFYNGHSHEEQLIHAAASGDEKGVRYLVGVGALPNCTEKVTGRTPLCYASKYGQTSMVKFLLAAGANPNVKDCAGWTITEHAAYRGHEEVLKMVLDAIKGHKSVVGTTRIDELSLNGFAGSKTDHAIALDSPALPLTSVIVNLGSPHSASHHSPIQLVSPSLASTDGSLSVEVSVFGAAEDPCVVTLPVMEDLSNKPCVFTVDATMNRAALLVKLFRSQGHTRVLEGVGSALIGSLDEDTTPILENVGELKKIPLHAEQHETLVAVFSYSLLVVKAAPKEVSSTSGLPWHFGEGIGGHRGESSNALNEFNRAN